MTKCIPSSALVGAHEKSEFHVLLVGTGKSGKYIFLGHIHFFNMYHSYATHDTHKRCTHPLANITSAINVTY